MLDWNVRFADRQSWLKNIGEYCHRAELFHLQYEWNATDNGAGEFSLLILNAVLHQTEPPVQIFGM